MPRPATASLPLPRKTDYSFRLHRDVLLEFITRLDLRNITLVCQGWSGLLGLTLPMDMPNRFSRLVVMNTSLRTWKLRFNPTFRTWRMWAALSPNLSPGRVVKVCEWQLSKAERAAYDAPFPNRRYKAGARLSGDGPALTDRRCGRSSRRFETAPSL